MLFNSTEDVRITWAAFNRLLMALGLALGASLVWMGTHSWLTVFAVILSSLVASIHASVRVQGSAGAVKEMREVCKWAGYLTSHLEGTTPDHGKTRTLAHNLARSVAELRARDKRGAKS